MMTPSLWVLREPHHTAVLRNMLRKQGIAVRHTPTIRCVANQPVTQIQADLHQAMHAQVAIFTSPHAVRFAQACAHLAAMTAEPWAIGSVSANTFAQLTGRVAQTGYHATSESLLESLWQRHPQLASMGLITAPDGRGHLESALQARGVCLHRADVYRREQRVLSAATVHRLRHSFAPQGDALGLFVTSLQAWRWLDAQLSPDVRNDILTRPVWVSSARLHAAMCDAGLPCDRVHITHGVHAQHMANAMREYCKM